MATRTKEYLKARFATGMKPSQADFGDLIDSLVHVSDIEAVDAAVVDARINNYDTAQKEQSGDEDVTTIGDVLHVLRNVGALADLQALIDAASGEVTWGTISGKPATLPVTWEEHTISVSDYAGTPVTTYEGLTAKQLVKELAPPSLIAGKKWVILDVSITQVPIAISGSTLIYPVHRIRAITIGVSPRIAIT